MYQGVGPEFAAFEFLVNKCFYPWVADFQEAFDVAAVVVDDFVSQVENVEGLGIENWELKILVQLILCLIVG